MNHQILLISKDDNFSQLFSGYVNRSQHEFSVACFTIPEKAISYLQEHETVVQAVLADLEFLGEYQDSNVLRICLSDLTQSSAVREEIHYLNIFQRRRNILSDLQLILDSNCAIPRHRQVAGGSRVISFFSVQGGSGKTTLAYATALQAAQEHKTAYISLEPAPFSEYLYQSPKSGMTGGEFLYAVRDQQDQAKTVLSALNHNAHNVYVLPTPLSLLDLLELTPEDWKFILDGLIQYGQMEYIILDLGSELSDINKIAFEQSSLLAFVYTDDYMGQGKRDLFFKDPNFPNFGISCPVVELRNLCQKKSIPNESIISFPFLQMTRRENFSTLLLTNPQFSENCKRLLQTLKEA